jgi:hypothetical protein
LHAGFLVVHHKTVRFLGFVKLKMGNAWTRASDGGDTNQTRVPHDLSIPFAATRFSASSPLVPSPLPVGNLSLSRRAARCRARGFSRKGQWCFDNLSSDSGELEAGGGSAGTTVFREAGGALVTLSASYASIHSSFLRASSRPRLQELRRRG